MRAAGPLRAGLLLLGKDLRLLVRSPGPLLVLVLYPLLVALLVAGALQESERQPTIAVVNLDSSGRTVEVAGQRRSVADYIGRIGEDATVLELDQRQAAAALEDGRVSAVLTIPANFVADLQSGLRSPRLTLETSRRDPLAAQALVRRLEAAVFAFNRALATGYVDQVVALVNLVIDGGRLGVFGRTGEALGLVRSRELVLAVQEDLRSRGDAVTATALDPLVDFIDATRANLDLAGPAAAAIRSPIELQVASDRSGREPLTAFGAAAALLVSLGLIGLLLGASALAGEREDGVLARLVRTAARPWVIVTEKTLLVALISLALGGALLAALTVAAGLAGGRPLWWLATLVCAGAAIGSLGSLAGAVARDTRSAMLVALMIGVPAVALALIPSGGVAGTLAALSPFDPALTAFQALLADPVLDAGRLLVSLGTLVAMATLCAAAATAALRRKTAG